MVVEKTVKIRVDKSMQEALENFRRSVAIDLKKMYNIDEVTVYGTLASKILAAKMKGDRFLQIKIKKNGSNKGTLEII